jgi:hypothetical protein
MQHVFDASLRYAWLDTDRRSWSTSISEHEQMQPAVAVAGAVMSWTHVVCELP